MEPRRGYLACAGLRLIPALPSGCCVTLAQLLYLSEPQKSGLTRSGLGWRQKHGSDGLGLGV